MKNALRLGKINTDHYPLEFNEKSTNKLKVMTKPKDVKTIFVEKTDRLYRNLKDYVLIDEIENVEIHFVKEEQILSEVSRSQDKFMHGIRVLMAKNYIENLSEEMKRRGFFPKNKPCTKKK